MKIKTTQTVVILIVFLLSLFGGIHAQDKNTTYGEYAGDSLTTGVNNTFIGWSAGRFTTTGNNNTFLGQSAGYKNITVSDNTFLGWCAGYANTEVIPRKVKPQRQIFKKRFMRLFHFSFFLDAYYFCWPHP